MYREKSRFRTHPRLRILRVFFLTYSIDYQGLEGLDGVESLITNVGGRLLMLQRDKNYPERKTKKVSRNGKASNLP